MSIKDDSNNYDGIINETTVQIKGIVGSCFCCSKPLHIQSETIPNLPIAKVNGDLYYVLLCDACEDDLETLRQSGIEHVSYDILATILQPLEEELTKLDELGNFVTDEDRNKKLIEYYNSFEKELKKDIYEDLLKSKMSNDN